MGNQGTDKGSMAGAIDAKCNYVQGEPNEYMVLERQNCRVQSFRITEPGAEECLLDHFFFYT